MKENLAQLFERHIERIPECGCWIWMGAVDPNGYGRINVGNNRTKLVHRISWMLYKGPIPQGTHVLHRCDVPACCNPAHLFLGSHRDNMDDMLKKKRNRFGQTAPWAKLTYDEVRFAHASNLPHRETGAILGINEAMVRLIQYGQRWRHLGLEPRPRRRPKKDDISL